MLYDVAETFYSLKGEGRWTGTPMFFIRLAGCNLNCPWCDTDYQSRGDLDENHLVEQALHFKTLGADRVVITGGEPLLQDLSPLVHKLHYKERFKVHLETNGTLPLDPHMFEWIACCPKSPLETLQLETLRYCDELKFLCGLEDWREYINQVLTTLKSAKHFDSGHAWPLLLLMPLAYPLSATNGQKLDWSNVTQAIDYCKDNAQFSLCMQLHKVLNIK